WEFPKWQVQRLAGEVRDRKALADIEDNLRKTVGQALAGAAVVIGAGFAFFQFLDQQKTEHDRQETARSQLLLEQKTSSAQQQQEALQQQVSNRLSKGLEQLAADNEIIRLSGIYALDSVIDDPNYQLSLFQVLCTFVRKHTIGKSVPKIPALDIQGALTVIGY